MGKKNKYIRTDGEPVTGYLQVTEPLPVQPMKTLNFLITYFIALLGTLFCLVIAGTVFIKRYFWQRQYPGSKFP